MIGPSREMQGMVIMNQSDPETMNGTDMRIEEEIVTETITEMMKEVNREVGIGPEIFTLSIAEKRSVIVTDTIRHTDNNVSAPGVEVVAGTEKGMAIQEVRKEVGKDYLKKKWRESGRQ